MKSSKNLWNFRERTSKLKRNRAKLLSLIRRNGSPLYVYDPSEATANYNRFVKAFRAAGTPVKVFYAIKTNYYSGLLKTVSKLGGGLDASSIREFELALKARPKRLVYTGPGKTKEDFEILVKHRSKLTIHLESFHELKTLGELLEREKISIRCGVRISSSVQKKWSKFGIPLADLRRFWTESKRYPRLKLSGIQFHISHLFTPYRHTKTIKEVGEYLKKHFSPDEIKGIEFLDIGGGIYPEVFEGVYPWNTRQNLGTAPTSVHLKKILSDKIQPRCLKVNVTPIEEYAMEISKALRRYIFSLNPKIEIFAEPGRFIAYSTLHILFSVLDIKNPQTIIVDAGNNAVGWEKHQYYDYAPIFNLNHLDLSLERPMLVYGCLCTPSDLWGYYIHGKTVKIGDVLCVAYSGDYTYTLAQNFIRPVPKVVDLK